MSFNRELHEPVDQFRQRNAARLPQLVGAGDIGLVGLRLDFFGAKKTEGDDRCRPNRAPTDEPVDDPAVVDGVRDRLTGLFDRERAADLGLSVKTIANNVSNIFSKLQVADRSEAIVRARDAGLG